MRLKFSLARTGRPVVDMAVTVDATVTVGGLATALDRCDPDREFRRATMSDDRAAAPTDARLSLRVHPGTGVSGPSTVLPADLPLSVSGLRSGSLISLAAVSERFTGPRGERGTAAATLAVLSGPDAGQEFALAEGTSVIGRDAGCDVRLTDPLVSKRHARITVSDLDGGQAEVVDAGSANGLIIGGTAVPRAVVRPQDRIILGETAIGITVHRSVAAALAQTSDVDFNRSPRLDPTFAGEQFEAPDPPDKPNRQRFPLIAMLAPLLMGVLLFAFTRSALSIVFIGLSPLFMIGSWADNRIQNRRLVRDGDRAFAESVHQMRQELAAALARERVGRLAECPATAEVVDAMRRQTPLLWTRRREHERMLTVRLGVGTQPSRHTVELPNRHSTQVRHWLALTSLRDDAAQVPGVPVVGDLPDSGSIGVAGPRVAAVGVARGVVAQLAGLHSPAEVVLAAITSAQSKERWEWLQWLPHVGSGHSPLTGDRLAAGPAAAARLCRLEDLIDQREAASQAAPGPGPASTRSARTSRNRCCPPCWSGRRGRRPGGPRPGSPGSSSGARDSGVHVMWVASSVQQLPAACRDFMAVDGDHGTTTGQVRLGRHTWPRCAAKASTPASPPAGPHAHRSSTSASRWRTTPTCRAPCPTRP